MFVPHLQCFHCANFKISKQINKRKKQNHSDQSGIQINLQFIYRFEWIFNCVCSNLNADLIHFHRFNSIISALSNLKQTTNKGVKMWMKFYRTKFHGTEERANTLNFRLIKINFLLIQFHAHPHCAPSTKRIISRKEIKHILMQQTPNKRMRD